jgi:hypothetical protein
MNLNSFKILVIFQKNKEVANAIGKETSVLAQKNMYEYIKFYYWYLVILLWMWTVVKSYYFCQAPTFLF